LAALLAGLRGHNAAQAKSIAVGLIFDSPNIDQTSYCWLAMEGLRRAENELGVAGTVYTTTKPEDFLPRLETCIQDGNDLCISVSFFSADPALQSAEQHPGRHFAVIDYIFPISTPHNLRGIYFAEDEAGYLAGVLAGMLSKDNLVGGIGGIPVPAVVRYLEGYRNGAYCQNASTRVALAYTNDFDNPQHGAQAALGLIDLGADVIFAAAGLSGHGAILTSTQSGILAIGVDNDQYLTLFMSGTVPGAQYLVTSAMKRFDNAVYDTIADVISGTFTSGNQLYNLEVNGVGLAPFHEADPLITTQMRQALEAVEKGIISGQIEIYDPCRQFQYLPLVIH